MPAKGKLAAISRKKYGKRPDERPKARKKLFEGMKAFIHSQALIQSDQNPHYPIDVKAHFPEAQHQGELKKTGFDPYYYPHLLMFHFINS